MQSESLSEVERLCRTESRVDVRLQLPDHLQHQEFVEIRIEQRANDRIDAEGMIMDAGGEIGDHPAPRISLAAAARASSVMVAPASMRAISSRRAS